MINEMNTHYSMTNPATVHDEEALTTLELAGRTTAKVNEVVRSQNKHMADTQKHLSEQDADIENQKNVVIPKTIKDEVSKYIHEGEFDKAIDLYAGELVKRVNNLLSSVTQGSTTLDAEIIDARFSHKGDTYNNLGTHLRKEFDRVFHFGQFVWESNYPLEINSVDKTIKFPSPLYISCGDKRYDVAKPNDVDFSDVGSNIFYIAYDIENKNLKALYTADYTNSDYVPFLVVDLMALNYGKYCFAPYIGNVIINGEEVNGITDKYPLSSGFGQVFHRSEHPALIINTNNKTIESLTTFYVNYGSMRYDAVAKKVSYEHCTGTTLYGVVLQEKIVESNGINYRDWDIIDQALFNPSVHVIMFQIQLNSLTNINSNNIPFSYEVDGVLYNNLDNTIKPESSGEYIVYVNGLTGSDSNKGTTSNPLKTIQKAIEKGATTIICEPCDYNEAIVVSNKSHISIKADWSKYSKGVINRPKVNITSGVKLTPSQNGTLKSIEYMYSQGGYLDKVFIEKSLEPTHDNGRSVGHYVTLWCENEIIKLQYRLTPVLSLEECQNTEESFFYDGSAFHINSIGTSFVLVETDTPHAFSNCDNVTLEGISFSYQLNDCLLCSDVHNLVAKECSFNFSSLSNGIALSNTNCDLSNCVALKNRNDGFNLYHYGESVIQNCVGCYNLDDGISHHDGCKGVIIGGQYNYNGKGGVSSPAHGCCVDTYNAVLGNNGYGVYAYSDTNIDNVRDIVVNGCYIHDNNIGIGSGYNLLSINNKFKNNNSDTTGNVTVI